MTIAGECAATRRSAQAGGAEDDVAGEGVELATGDALGDRDRRRVVVDEALPADVSAHDPDEAVADLFAVHDHLGSVLEQLVQLAVEGAQPRGGVLGVERAVARADAELLVVVEVVRRRDDRDHAAEPVLTDPDDLLLAAHPAAGPAVD